MTSFDRIYASNKNLAEKEYDLIIDFDPDYDAEIIFPGSMVTSIESSRRTLESNISKSFIRTTMSFIWTFFQNLAK